MSSREFLDSVRCTEDIVYKTSGGHRLLLDLYGPARPSGLPGPLLLLLHGGGWFRQSKKTEIVPRLHRVNTACIPREINTRYSIPLYSVSV